MSSPLDHRARFVCPRCGEPFPVRTATGPVPLAASSGPSPAADLIGRELGAASIHHHLVDPAQDDADSLVRLLAAAPFTLLAILDEESPHPSFTMAVHRALQLRLTPVFLVEDTLRDLPHELGPRLGAVDLDPPRLPLSLLQTPGALASALAQTAKNLLAARQVFCGSCSTWARFDRYLEPGD